MTPANLSRVTQDYFALRRATNDGDLGIMPTAILLALASEKEGEMSTGTLYELYGSNNSHLRRATYLLEERKLIKRSSVNGSKKPTAGALVKLELTAKGRKHADGIASRITRHLKAVAT